MATLYDLKPRFQALLRPMVDRLAGRGVTANQVTVAAMALSLAHGTAIFAAGAAVWTLLLLPVTLFLRMGLNAVDGMLAREHDQKSQGGAVLNELGDMVSDAALYLPLATVAGLPALLVVLAVVVAIVAEATGILAQALTGERRYDGPMGKSDRALAFSVLALAAAFQIVSPGVLEIATGAIVALGVWTIWNRARAAARSDKSVGNGGSGGSGGSGAA